MTLLVGLNYPWKQLADTSLYKALMLLQSESGIIIASDSRWTYDHGRHEDGAVKVFGLGTSGVMAYAGRVGPGERALAALAQALGRTQTVDEYHAHMQRILASERHSCAGDSVDILVGVSSKDGGALLSHASNADGFAPRLVDDLIVVGPSEAKNYFLQSLRAAVAINTVPRSGESRPVPTIHSWAALVLALVSEVGAMNIHPDVGGPVTGALTTSGRGQPAGVTQIGRVGDTLRAEVLSLEPSAGKTVLREWKVAPTDAETAGDNHQ